MEAMQNFDVNSSEGVDTQGQTDLSNVASNQDDVKFDSTKTLFLKNKLTTTSV